MKHYNIQNYIRYKEDLEITLKRVEKKDWHEYTRNELIIVFLPLATQFGIRLISLCSANKC